MPRGGRPISDEQRAAMREGQRRYFEERRKNGEQALPRKKKERPEVGRFSIDSLGSVTILDDDLVHGVTLRPDVTRELAAFLARCVPQQTTKYEIPAFVSGVSLAKPAEQ